MQRFKTIKQIFLTLHLGKSDDFAQYIYWKLQVLFFPQTQGQHVPPCPWMAQVISPSPPHLAPTTSHRVQKQVTWAPTRCCYWCGFCLAAAGWMLLSLNWLRITLLHTSLTLIWASWVFEYQHYLEIFYCERYILPLRILGELFHHS